MGWAYTQAGKEIPCPDSERGLHVEGPLNSEDWRMILGFIVEELIEQSKREERDLFDRCELP
jgi:hypothetical protein